jgi:hypothetical protein
MCERMVLRWAYEMVTMWVRAVIGDRCVVVNVVLDNCRSFAVGADVAGVLVEGRQGRLDC